jgi:hypothetical protein
LAAAIIRAIILFVVIAGEGLRVFVNMGVERILLGRWLIAFCVTFQALTYRHTIANLHHVSSRGPLPSVSWRFGALHLAAIAVLVLISKQIPAIEFAKWSLSLFTLAGIWFAIVFAAVTFAGLALLPHRFWREKPKPKARELSEICLVRMEDRMPRNFRADREIFFLFSPLIK